MRDLVVELPSEARAEEERQKLLDMSRRNRTIQFRLPDRVDRVGLLIVLLVAPSLLWAASAYAGGLACPTLDRSGVAMLGAVSSQIRRMTNGDKIDLANEIDALIRQLRARSPTLSNDAVTDILIAAYCPAVAGMTNTSPAEKWRLMRQFDRVLIEQLAANTSKGSSIIANVPLSLSVYRDLSQQAKVSGQNTTDFMAGILTSAAGP